MEFLSDSEVRTRQYAADLAARLQAGDTLYLYGELGAGKTAFTRGIVGYFDSGIDVTSPSFSMINIYPTRPEIVHVDLYRIAGERDVDDLGLSELIDSDSLVVVEWAEKCESIAPKRLFRVRMAIVSEEERRISIEECNSAYPGA